MMTSSKVRVLFVCLGNICRSPMAQGVFARYVEAAGLEGIVEVDSAGTHAFHIGESPDLRACAAALKRGVDLSHQRARRVGGRDFEEFDYVLAMDRDNYAYLQSFCPAEFDYKLRCVLDFAPQLGEREVPDPYYGGGSGFEKVLDMIESVGEGLLRDIRKRYLGESADVISRLSTLR